MYMVSKFDRVLDVSKNRNKSRKNAESAPIGWRKIWHV